MNLQTYSRYWMEFYQYEQWLIDNNVVSSRQCYSQTHRIDEIYFKKLYLYARDIKERYKESTVKSKLSRLIQCMKVMNSYY